MTEPNKQIEPNIKKNLSLKSGLNNFQIEKGGSKYFGIELHNRVVKRFKLLFRTGKQVSIPYAFLPIIILENTGLLRIKTNDFIITISGRGLKTLEEYLSNEQIRWIKESISEFDKSEETCFISQIEIEGELDI